MAFLRYTTRVCYKTIMRQYTQEAAGVVAKKMPRTRNLLEYTPTQMLAFLNSFDYVLSDCDGVLWHLVDPIPGAMETLKAFQHMGKKLYLVSNNTMLSTEHYCQKAQMSGLDCNPEQIISPLKVTTWYLKKINFTGQALAIASDPFREALRKAGIDMVGELPHITPSDFTTVKYIEDQPSIKAVIADFNVYCNWAHLALAISCLKRKEVLYICGAREEWVKYGIDKKILGPGPLINIISNHSGREPIDCAKPGEVLKEYIMEACKVQDPQRCLFIGDSITQDMNFGAICGFQKLFVCTGLDRIEDAQKDEKSCPEYFIPSLGQLGPLFKSVHYSSIHSYNS